MRGKHFSVTRSVSHSLILMLRLSVSDTSTIITGLYAQAAQIPGKWLQILEELSRAFGSWQRCWTRMLRSRAWHSKRSCSNFPTGSRLMRANAPSFASAKIKIQNELNNASGREAPRVGFRVQGAERSPFDHLGAARAASSSSTDAMDYVQ
jgi:hypothetical protein